MLLASDELSNAAHSRQDYRLRSEIDVLPIHDDERKPPHECSVGNAVLSYLERRRYPTGNQDALFLRWRETIEKAMSDKFDLVGEPAAVSVKLFLKDFKTTHRLRKEAKS